MKILLANTNLFCLVDGDLGPDVTGYAWALNSNGYAVRTVKNERGCYSSLRMHRLITHAPKGLDVDHVNGNRLDNRRSNLRICTRAENVRNSPKRINRAYSSCFKGVCFVTGKLSKPWRAQIKTNYQTIQVGYFATEVDAANAYNRAALQVHGPFARLNILTEEMLHDRSKR